MTEAEIMKALECCGNQLDCVGCECVENCPQDINELNGLAFDLINRKNAENEKLCGEVDELIIAKDQLFDEAEALIEKARAEAIKEFAERVKEEIKIDKFFLAQIEKEMGVEL
jgi:hypothetical protein